MAFLPVMRMTRSVLFLALRKNMGRGRKNMGKTQDSYRDSDRNPEKCYFPLTQFWPESRSEANITNE